MFVFVCSLSFLCPLWSLSLEWPRTRSGLLWCQADRALGHIQNGDRNHRAVVHVDTRKVAICLERDNPTSAKSSVKHDLQTEDHFLQSLKLGMLQISLQQTLKNYQIKLLVLSNFFQKIFSKAFLILIVP